jgi:hypothetical protein
MQSFTITFSVRVHPGCRGGSTSSLVVDTKLPDDLILDDDPEINPILLQRKLQERRRELHNMLCDVQTTGVVELYAYDKYYDYLTYPEDIKKIDITDIDVTDIKKFVFAIKSSTWYCNKYNRTHFDYSTVLKFLIGLTKAEYSYQVVDAVYHMYDGLYPKILVNKPNAGVDLLL